MVLDIAAALPITGKRRFAQCLKCLHGMRESNLNLKRCSSKVFFLLLFLRYNISLLAFMEIILLCYKDGKKHPFLSFRTTLVLSKIFLMVYFSQWKCGLPVSHQAYHSWYKSFLSITAAIYLSHPLKSRENALIILLTSAGVLALQNY